MTSGDAVRVEINGSEYAVISGRLETIEKDNREMNYKLDLVLVRMEAINMRIEDMKFYMSLTFGAIAIFVAAVTLSPIVSKIIQAWRKPDERLRGIVRDEFARLKAGE